MSNLLTRLRARRAETGDKGFTLVELLVVVVIIGVLIAIAIPVYLNYTKGAKDKSAAADLRNAVVALEQCQSDNNTYPAMASTTWTNAAVANPCSGQTITISPNTNIKYTPSATSGNAISYVAQSWNTGGKITYYCYDSTVGGSVVSKSTAFGNANNCS